MGRCEREGRERGESERGERGGERERGGEQSRHTEYRDSVESGHHTFQSLLVVGEVPGQSDSCQQLHLMRHTQNTRNITASSCMHIITHYTCECHVLYNVHVYMYIPAESEVFCVHWSRCSSVFQSCLEPEAQ